MNARLVPQAPTPSSAQTLVGHLQKSIIITLKHYFLLSIFVGALKLLHIIFPNTPLMFLLSFLSSILRLHKIMAI